jgi:phosphoglucosamine mutase
MALEENSWRFGGEQTGHLIFRQLAPTGDGLLTGLILADLVVRRGPLAEQARAAWLRVPQALINVKESVYDNDAVLAIFSELRALFGIADDDVRLIVRPSGTEPVVRVMVEALDGAFVAEFSTRMRSHFSS